MRKIDVQVCVNARGNELARTVLASDRDFWAGLDGVVR